LAELWHAKLERTGSIAAGADKCDFWGTNKTEESKKIGAKEVTPA
jgi:hypothetical protein